MKIDKLKKVLLEAAELVKDDDVWVPTGEADDIFNTLIMTDEEVFWHKRITAVLLNKNKKWGIYQHALYAKRFQDFCLKIVPRSVDKDFTACVIFKRNVIYVGEGFLKFDDKNITDDKLLAQLSPIIRHEMAHVLLRHQIRIMEKIGKDYPQFATSTSLQGLLNIVADFEISNRKYTPEDKEAIKALISGGKTIVGLVTEMHRKDWLKLSVEEMYEKLLKEANELQYSMNSGEMRYSSVGSRLSDKDMITTKNFNALQHYMNDEESLIWSPIEEFFEKSKLFKKIDPKWQELIKITYEAAKGGSEEDIKEQLQQLKKSKIFEEFDVIDLYLGDVKAFVYTPEEKFWVAEVFKNLTGNARPRPKTTVKKLDHSADYKAAYNIIIRSCGSRAKCSDDELGDIIASAFDKIAATSLADMADAPSSAKAES